MISFLLPHYYPLSLQRSLVWQDLGQHVEFHLEGKVKQVWFTNEYGETAYLSQSLIAKDMYALVV